MYNTHNEHDTNFIKALVCDAVQQGITEPKKIVKHIAGTYTTDRKEIVKNEPNNTNGRRDDQSHGRR